MKRCCKCKKIIWIGQQSNIAFSPIHKKCHRKSIEKHIKENPDTASLYLNEMSDFTDKTGLNPF
tara:strand:- start:490 stop:681 length:192 start_codon:yes stop_codon:yes gene_type:complete